MPNAFSLQHVPDCGRSHKIKPVYIYGSVLDEETQRKDACPFGRQRWKDLHLQEVVREKFERQRGSVVTNVCARRINVFSGRG